MVATVEILAYSSGSMSASPLSIYWHNLQSSIANNNGFEEKEDDKIDGEKCQELDSIAPAVGGLVMMDDIWIVSDNARSHECKRLLLQFPFSNIQYNQHLGSSNGSLSITSFQHASPTDQKATADFTNSPSIQPETSTGSVNPNNLASSAQDQWDRTKDSVVGFGNAKKNRWGTPSPAVMRCQSSSCTSSTASHSSISSTMSTPMGVPQFCVDPAPGSGMILPPFSDDRSRTSESIGSCPSDGSALPLTMPSRRESFSSMSTSSVSSMQIDALMTMPRRRTSRVTDENGKEASTLSGSQQTKTWPERGNLFASSSSSSLDRSMVMPQRRISDTSSNGCSIDNCIELPARHEDGGDDKSIASAGSDTALVLPKRRLSVNVDSEFPNDQKQSLRRERNSTNMDEDGVNMNAISCVDSSLVEENAEIATGIPQHFVGSQQQTVNDGCDKLAASDQGIQDHKAPSQYAPKSLSLRSRRVSMSRRLSMDSIPEISEYFGAADFEDDDEDLHGHENSVKVETGGFNDLNDSLEFLKKNGDQSQEPPSTHQHRDSDFSISISQATALNLRPNTEKTEACNQDTPFISFSSLETADGGGFGQERRSSGVFDSSSFPPRMIGAARTRLSETSILSLDWLEDWMVDQIREEDELSEDERSEDTRSEGDGAYHEKNVRNSRYFEVGGVDGEYGIDDSTAAEESTVVVRKPPTRTDSRELALDRRYERRHAIVAQALAASRQIDTGISASETQILLNDGAASAAGSVYSNVSSTPSMPPLIETISHRDGHRRSSGYTSKYLRALQVVNMSTFIAPVTMDLPALEPTEASEEVE